MMKSLVIMPFATAFDPVLEAVTAAAQRALPADEIDCTWLKDAKAAGRISDDILDGIGRSTFCIADVTGNNANVMWETGYAMALGKPTILIGQSVDSLPFDLKMHRVLEYDPSELGKLTIDLAEAIQQTLSRYDLRAKADKALRPPSGSKTIAVTGSMHTDSAKLARRIEVVLPPYLDEDVAWLCGSDGMTDETVLDFLITHEQRATAVGYNRYDFSPIIREMVESDRVGIIDASIESLPKGLDGPTERDRLFASRADLAIVFWDGRSAGTKQLIDYFTDNGTNLLIGFI